MPIGLQRGYKYGREPQGGKICGGALFRNKDERIKDIRQSIRINEALIHYYELLIDDYPENHLSFQAYLREIDKRAEVIKEERRRLIAQYNKASNGEIPSLQQQQIELQKKLKQLTDVTKKNKTKRRKKKAEWLGKRIADLEQQLRDEGFDIQDLMDAL